MKLRSRFEQVGVFFFTPTNPQNNPGWNHPRLSQFWSKFQRIGCGREEKKAILNQPELLLICSTAPSGTRIWHLVTQNSLDICLHYYIFCLTYLLLTFAKQPAVQIIHFSAIKSKSVLLNRENLFCILSYGTYYDLKRKNKFAALIFCWNALLWLKKQFFKAIIGNS